MGTFCSVGLLVVVTSLSRLSQAGSIPVRSAFVEDSMNSKYRSWTTEALLEEVKRLKKAIKEDISYFASSRHDKLRDVIHELQRRK